MKLEHFLFNVGELQDKDCRAFNVPDGAFEKEIFVVAMGGGLYAYVNSCPHLGSPLDWMPNQFLNLDKTLIQCSTHHALFQVHDGLCVHGPCSGQKLTAVPLSIVEEKVYAIIEGE